MALLADNRALPVNHFQTVVDNTLTIQKVQKLYDAGRYTCQAQNEAGMGMQRSVYVSVVGTLLEHSLMFTGSSRGSSWWVLVVKAELAMMIVVHWL